MTTDEERAGLALEAVVTAAMKERGARAVLAEAEADLDAALVDAREAGVPWVAIEERTGMSRGQLQWRYHRDDPAHREAVERKRAQRAATPRNPQGPRPGRGPGVSVTDWAREHGISRTAVYKQMAAGRLEWTENELGQKRILGVLGADAD